MINGIKKNWDVALPLQEDVLVWVDEDSLEIKGLPMLHNA